MDSIASSARSIAEASRADMRRAPAGEARCADVGAAGGRARGEGETRVF